MLEGNDENAVEDIEQSNTGGPTCTARASTSKDVEENSSKDSPVDEHDRRRQDLSMFA